MRCSGDLDQRTARIPAPGHKMLLRLNPRWTIQPYRSVRFARAAQNQTAQYSVKWVVSHVSGRPVWWIVTSKLILIRKVPNLFRQEFEWEIDSCDEEFEWYYYDQCDRNVLEEALGGNRAQRLAEFLCWVWLRSYVGFTLRNLASSLSFCFGSQSWCCRF